MSAEGNKAVVRRYGEDFWGKGNLAIADALFTPDIRDHHPELPNQAPGREGQQQVLSVFRTAFPDLQVTNDDIIAEGEKVVLRWTARGTHRGELLGIPPTGRQVTIRGIDILRLEGGKIAERWAESNSLELMQQLGVIPAPGQAGQ
jgi:steroid delta-isomerase-like uncharacterized protein